MKRPRWDSLTPRRRAAIASGARRPIAAAPSSVAVARTSVALARSSVAVARRRLGHVAIFALALALLVAPAVRSAEAAPQRRAAWAITGATVITAPGQQIENATVVVRDGLIEAVGANLTAPADARLIDGSGMTVYAGWIDGWADVAIEQEEGAQGAPTAGRGGGGRGGRGGGQQALQMLELGAPGVNDQAHPEYDQANHLNGEDAAIAGFRNAGFTTALVVPQDGIYRGKSVLIALREGDPEDIVVRDDVAQTVGFSTGGFGRGYPSSLMGVISEIRQVLLDTQRYSTWENSYDNDPSGIPRPDANPAYTALQPVLRGDQQVIFDANNTRAAKRALEIGQEFGLAVVIKGNGNEYEMADQLAEARVGLIVPVDYPDRPTVGTDADANLDISLDSLQRWERAPGNAAALERAGIAFAFTADGVEPGDFAANVRKAIDAGLSAQAALAAVTTNPARLLGVANILGTIEAGKIANIVVATGAPFAEDTEVRHVFIDGIHSDVEQAAGGGGGRGGRGGDMGPADPRGTWSVTMGAGDFSQEMKWTIGGQSGAYYGSAEGAQGSLDFDRVTLAGNRLSVSMSSPMGQFDLTVTLQGDRLSGNLDANGFAVAISGRRVSGPGHSAGNGALHGEHGGQR